MFEFLLRLPDFLFFRSQPANDAAGDENTSVVNGKNLPGPSEAKEKPTEPSAADIAKINEIKRAIEQMKLMQSIQGQSSSSVTQPKNVEEAKKKKYEFWETQPVPKLSDDTPVPIEVNEAIDPNTDVEKVRKEPLPLPEGFVWVAMDIDNSDEVRNKVVIVYIKLTFSLPSSKSCTPCSLKTTSKTMTTCSASTTVVTFFSGSSSRLTTTKVGTAAFEWLPRLVPPRPVNCLALFPPFRPRFASMISKF